MLLFSAGVFTGSLLGFVLGIAFFAWCIGEAKPKRRSVFVPDSI